MKSFFLPNREALITSEAQGADASMSPFLFFPRCQTRRVVIVNCKHLRKTLLQTFSIRHTNRLLRTVDFIDLNTDTDAVRPKTLHAIKHVSGTLTFNLWWIINSFTQNAKIIYLLSRNLIPFLLFFCCFFVVRLATSQYERHRSSSVFVAVVTLLALPRAASRDQLLVVFDFSVSLEEKKKVSCEDEGTGNRMHSRTALFFNQ